MNSIKQPDKIIFGINSASKFPFPKNSLVITSRGAKSRGWLDYLGITDYNIFDSVDSNPSYDLIEKILNEFKNNFSNIIGIGGGSSLDVAKFIGFKSKKRKILIPTTFGSGSEVTRISVLKIDGKKTSFHDDNLFSDLSIIDPYFINDTPFDIIKNSAIDACAQCTEAYDSKSSNIFTKFLCEKAFDILENAIITENFSNLPYGSLLSGLGFGNSSTTLGHALSYVYSNEGISHGHALAFTTTVAHEFNNSKFFNRFKQLVEKLNFVPISLKQDFNTAAKIIMSDKKHIDNNPLNLTNEIIINLLKKIQQIKSD